MKSPSLCLRILLLLCIAWVTASCASLPGAAGERQAGSGAQILITFSRGEEHEADLLNSFNNAYHRGDYSGSPSTRRMVAGVVTDYPISEQAGWIISSLDVYCGLFNVAPDTDIDQLLQQLDTDSRVESAQLMYSYSTRAATGYNDPYFDLQYGRARPFILSLHQISTGEGVDVAVIDTGVDIFHPDLRQQVAVSRNFIDAREKHPEGEIHGTAMAGIIAARGNNGDGIVGIAPGARIYALKACWQLQDGSGVALCDSFTLARALSFAIDRRLDIINLSLSGPRDPLVARLVSVALSQGQIVTAADPGPGEPRYPALLPGVIAVREEAETGSFPASDPETLVVHAPRGEVLSTGPGGRYDFYSGSSASTAIVSGLAALLLQIQEQLSSEGRVAWLNEAMRHEIGSAPTSTVPDPQARPTGRAGRETAARLLEF